VSRPLPGRSAARTRRITRAAIPLFRAEGAGAGVGPSPASVAAGVPGGGQPRRHPRRTGRVRSGVSSSAAAGPAVDAQQRPAEAELSKFGAPRKPLGPSRHPAHPAEGGSPRLDDATRLNSAADHPGAEAVATADGGPGSRATTPGLNKSLSFREQTAPTDAVAAFGRRRLASGPGAGPVRSCRRCDAACLPS
jgi:hypothetical protein